MIRKINETKKTTDELLAALRNNAQAILEDEDIMYNNGCKLDDINYGFLKKAVKHLIDVRAIISNVRNYSQSWATESKKTMKSGRKLKESNYFADEPIVMYYKGKKIFEGGSDELGVRAALSDLMYDDDKFYQDAKDFLENELGIEVTDIDDCAYTLADQIDTEATYADSIESFYIPFGEFEAFFKEDEAF
jgi:hypothetical protein